MWARQLGHTANYDQYATQVYQVNAPKPTAVTLSANPPSPQSLDTLITLTPTPTATGGQVEYQYRVGTLGATGWYLYHAQYRLHHEYQL